MAIAVSARLTASTAMGVLKGDARLACVDLSNFAERKHEITKQLMEAATTVGCVIDD